MGMKPLIDPRISMKQFACLHRKEMLEDIYSYDEKFFAIPMIQTWVGEVGLRDGKPTIYPKRCLSPSFQKIWDLLFYEGFSRRKKSDLGGMEKFPSSDSLFMAFLHIVEIFLSRNRRPITERGLRKVWAGVFVLSPYFHLNESLSERIERVTCNPKKEKGGSKQEKDVQLGSLQFIQKIWYKGKRDSL